MASATAQHLPDDHSDERKAQTWPPHSFQSESLEIEIGSSPTPSKSLRSLATLAMIDRIPVAMP